MFSDCELQNGSDVALPTLLLLLVLSLEAQALDLVNDGSDADDARLVLNGCLVR